MQRLTARGHRVRILTRSLDKAKDLPEGVEEVVGDLAAPESLRGPIDGMDGVFPATPLDPDETRLGLNAVEATKEAGIGRWVMTSA